jgi:hypothetical protein
MCDCPWLEPAWDRLSNRKHRKSRRRDWERSMTVAWSKQPGETAQFDPNLSDQQIEQMEMECVGRRDGTGRHGTLIREVCHKKTFYRNMGREIGASIGEKTAFIFVEYVNSGSVHGRPMTWEQIQEKIKRAAPG